MTQKLSKERSSDRILVLKTIDGTKPKSSTGLTDPRLFTGENKLHAVMDSSNCTWSFKYEAGVPPEPLKQRFTSFQKAYDHAVQYFKKRNIEITEVID